jgi:hypothetical protein
MGGLNAEMVPLGRLGLGWRLESQNVQFRIVMSLADVAGTKICINLLYIVRES